MEELEKITIVSGWKRYGEGEDDIRGHEVHLEGHIDFEDAIKQTSDEITSGYISVTHTVKKRKQSFNSEEVKKIRNQ